MNEVDRESAQEDNAEINLTPMLDVVFIMLIFFVVTAVFVQEPGVEINRPAAETASRPVSSIYVAISSENEIWLGGDVVKLDSLRYRIEHLHADSPGGGLVIQADAESNNQYTVAVIDAAKAAGIAPIVLAAARK